MSRRSDASAFTGTVDDPGGHTQSVDPDAFAAAINGLDASSISAIHVTTYSLMPTQTSHRIKIDADENGIVLEASGEDETWVRGVVEVLGSKLRSGVVPPYAPEKRKLTGGEKVVVGLIGLLMIAVLVLTIVLELPWWLGGLGIALLMFAPGFLDTLLDRGVRNPALQFISPGGKALATKKVGPILKAHAWLQAHPVVNLALGFVLGVSTNIAADGLGELWDLVFGGSEGEGGDSGTP